MASLDDAAALRDADTHDMLGAFLSLPGQLAASFEAGVGVEMPAATLLQSVVFCAVGGSAAAGDVVATAFGDAVELPTAVVRGYRLPGFCGPSTLVVCSSFSGKTEETVAAYREASLRGCRLVTVSSGGDLVERAMIDGVPAVIIPGDVAMPRAGLGYLVGGILGALTNLAVLDPRDHLTGAQGVLETLAEELAPDRPMEENEAKDLAAWLGDRIPLVWGSEGVSQAAAWRWKCAVNENAKRPAFAATFPELDHHEVVGWAAEDWDGFAVIVLRDEGEHESIPARLEATRAEMGGLPWREVRGRGASPLSRVLSLMLLGDLTSTYLGLASGFDPGPIDALTRIKERLAAREL